ncbi:MAG: alpha/beta hydrolase [Oscillospiraceae bacterium]|nr:alpha/beta hydrolase [Oscillospiraceae bacterium]
MIYEKIALYPNRPHITLTSYVSEISPELRNLKKPAVLVLPGGGYYITADREAEPVAKAFFAAGMNAFVLRYSVKEEAVGYAPLLDAATAVKYIRDNAERYNIDPDKLALCGFSAGGHLAASLGSLWKLDIISETLGCDNAYIKPSGMILGYPAIDADDSNLKPEEAHKSYNIFYSKKHVGPDTCPAFIWHTASDDLPVENSLYLCEALSKHKIPFELHIFPYGEHGLSLATKETAPNDGMVMPYVARWTDMALKWLEEILFA